MDFNWAQIELLNWAIVETPLWPSSASWYLGLGDAIPGTPIAVLAWVLPCFCLISKWRCDSWYMILPMPSQPDHQQAARMNLIHSLAVKVSILPWTSMCQELWRRLQLNASLIMNRFPCISVSRGVLVEHSPWQSSTGCDTGVQIWKCVPHQSCLFWCCCVVVVVVTFKLSSQLSSEAHIQTATKAFRLWCHIIIKYHHHIMSNPNWS